jgi:hypothetical protein
MTPWWHSRGKGRATCGTVRAGPEAVGDYEAAGERAGRTRR